MTICGRTPALSTTPPVYHAAQLLIRAARKLCVYRIAVEVGGKGLLAGVEEPNAARVPSVDDAARLNERARGRHQGGDVEGKRRRPACSHPRLGQPMPLTKPPKHAADLRVSLELRQEKGGCGLDATQLRRDIGGWSGLGQRCC